MATAPWRSSLVLAAIAALTPIPSWSKPPPRPATLYVKLPAANLLRARTVFTALERALTERQEVSLTPIRHLLEPAGRQLEALSEADKESKRGKALLANLEVEAGIAALTRAVSLQQEAFHLLSTSTSGIKDHATLLVDLSMAHFLGGDEKKAREVLQRALVLDPRIEYDKKRYPPQMKQMFDEVRFLVDELGTGDVKVVTKPPRAEVRANGEFVGFSPIRVKGMTAGINLISVSKPGYRTKTAPALVEGGGMVPRVVVALEPVQGRPAELLDAALREAEAGAAPVSLKKAARLLRQKVLFLAALSGPEEMITVQIYTYDAVRHRTSTRATATISSQDPDQECERLVASLFSFLQAPRVTARSGASPSTGWFGRFRRSRLFWPAVGVGAAIVAASVGIGVYYGTRERPDRGRQLLLLPAVPLGR